MNYRTRFSCFCLAAIAGSSSLACGGHDIEPSSDEPAPLPVETANVLDQCAGPATIDALKSEAGFVDAHGARLFYSFHPADEHPETAPLLVFTNGGAATTIMVPYGTGPYTLDPNADTTAPPVANPSSYTRFANLLYFDPRDLGFSYLTEPPAEGCNEDHDIEDAGDLILTVLDFLDAHDSLKDNPVAFVGESHGGVRVTLALDFLGAATDPERPSFLSDLAGRVPWLFDRVERHASLAFPRCAGPDSRKALDAQFGRQVLVQPGFAGLIFLGSSGQDTLPGKLMWDDPDLHSYFAALGAGVGGTSHYDVRRTLGEDQLLEDHVAAQLRDPRALELLLGVAPSAIQRLGPSNGRGTAYRSSAYDAAGAEAGLTDVLGQLGAEDAYWLPKTCGWGGTPEFDARVLDAFERNLRRVRTFMTNDRYDAMVYTEALPALLESRGSNVTAPETWDRTGELDVQSATDATPIHIRFPTYESGHEVTIGAPQAFGEDLAAWLDESE